MALDQQTIQKLKDYFASRDDVSMAFVFGSQAKGTAIAESDTDIAVYFKPEGRALEWERKQEFPNEDQIWTDIGRIADTASTDLVVLNRAASPIVKRILETGLPLLIRNRALYWHLLFLVSDATEDFLQIAKSWWQIRARSQSLTADDKILLLRLLDFVNIELSELPKFQKVDQFKYQNDRDMQRNLERWIERLAISLIDIAKTILSSEKKKALGQSYKDMVMDLGWSMDIAEASIKLMGDFAELRNLLAHEYLDLRYAKIRPFLDNAERIYAEVISYAKRYAEIA